MTCFPVAGVSSSPRAAVVERRGLDFTPDSRRSDTRFKTREAASLIGRMLNIPSFSLVPFELSEEEFRNAQKVFAKSDKPKGSGHEYYA